MLAMAFIEQIFGWQTTRWIALIGVVIVLFAAFRYLANGGGNTRHKDHNANRGDIGTSL